MSKIIKIGNAEIEKSNYNYFSTLYSKIPKEYIIADLVSKCEEYNRLYKSYEELLIKTDKAIEFLHNNVMIGHCKEHYELLEILGDKE